MEDRARVLIRVRSDLCKERTVWQIENSTLYHYKNDSVKIGYSCFEKVFNTSSNREIYDEEISKLVKDAINGRSFTVFAYGQTGSGKTHTMMGNGSEYGLIKYVVDDLFSIPEVKAKITYLEIYNEKVYDLIEPKNNVLLYNAGSKQEIKNAAVFSGKTKKTVFKMIDECEKRRRNGATEYNKMSSRSHTIFMMHISYKEFNSSINLIDLAGSEKATGDRERLLEGSFINKSLLALGTVVNSMANKSVVGFRDSKLTRLLQSSMCGNLKLIALCMISPLENCADESVSTLNFAARLGKIKLKSKKEIIKVKKEKKDVVLCHRCKCLVEGESVDELESDVTKYNDSFSIKSFYETKLEIDQNSLDYSDCHNENNKTLETYNEIINHDNSKKDEYIENEVFKLYRYFNNFAMPNICMNLERNNLNSRTSENLKVINPVENYMVENNLKDIENYSFGRKKYNKNGIKFDELEEVICDNENDGSDERCAKSQHLDKSLNNNKTGYLKENSARINEKSRFIDGIIRDLENCTKPKDFFCDLKQPTNDKEIFMRGDNIWNNDGRKIFDNIMKRNIYLNYKNNLLIDHLDTMERIFCSDIAFDENKKAVFLLEKKMYILRCKMLEKRFGI